MIALYIAIFLLVALAVTYVFLVMPRSVDAADMDLQSTDYALRGLHGRSVPENSLSAFALAKEEGYGILLDVSLSSDGRLVVVRDEALPRLCGVKRRVSALTYAQLSSLSLAGTAEHIPLLSRVLELIDGHVPLMISISPASNVPALCKHLCELMDTYSGAFSVISREPEILGFFKKYRPRYARGFTVAAGKAGGFARRHLLTNSTSRPDFILTDKRHVKEPAFLLATRVFRAKGFALAVRNESEYAICRKRGLYTVFKGFRPQ